VQDRLIVALDHSSREGILRSAEQLREIAGALKIGLQAFIANGPAIVRELVSAGHRVFVDLKVHDIPNTAAHAVKEIASTGAFMTTAHASGGEAMLRACVHEPLLVLGVTMLTSLEQRDLQSMGVSGSAEEHVVRLARLAKGSGLRGVVASPLEIESVRVACGEDFVIVTPGIRPAGSAEGDQRRTMTPREAVRAGASYIVVGRPITGAADPRSAALRVIEEMD
jgi:orotidine-5'-phosphate decarboxylase